MSIEPAPSGVLRWQSIKGSLEVVCFGEQTPIASRRLAEHVQDGSQMVIKRATEQYVEWVAESGGSVFANERNSRIRFSQPFMVATDGKFPGRYVVTLQSGLESQFPGWTILGKVRGDGVFWLRALTGTGTSRDKDGVLEYPVRGVGGEIVENVWGVQKKAKEHERTTPKDAKRPRKQVVLSFEDEEEGDALEIRMRPVKKAKKKKKVGPVEPAQPVQESVTKQAVQPPTEEAVPPPAEEEDATLQSLRRFQRSLREPVTPTPRTEPDSSGLSSEDEDLSFLTHRWTKNT
ncbi:hypothetical protein OGAPHI_001596 [Ogataea philodendri]|uniref:Uncharacterized protein n=1 Tax=Ogataea philodendri TaxID=1378263 RepID=A0A9P8PDA0_9ASCO|nr:uncharacterized protein OGAPHI_001596 [Ogataea philodendri]KAH3669475.1 hypothetical protein OGAPHI_001596 [Ogataea philodendri]